ncbi:reverse transcriptase domain-containing protein, partial [Tanacetum coccineum]
MPPRMRTRSVGRSVAESREGGTGRRVSRGGGRGRGPREGNDERIDELNGQGNDQGLGANGGVEGVNGNVDRVNGGERWECDSKWQPGGTGGRGGERGRRPREGNDERVDDLNGQGNNQGLRANEGVEGVNGNIEGAKADAIRLLQTIMRTLECVGKIAPGVLVVLIKSSLACKTEEYVICTLSQKVVVSMSWNDFKFMMIQEFCPNHEMQNLESELWNHTMVGAGHAAYTNKFHELARLVPHLIHGMVAKMKPKTIQKVVQISGALTDEAVRNGSIKKVEKRGNEIEFRIELIPRATLVAKSPYRLAPSELEELSGQTK